MQYFKVILLLSTVASMVYAESKPLKGFHLNHCKFFKKPHVGPLSTTTPLPVKSTTPVKFIPVEITTTTESNSYPSAPLIPEVYPPVNPVLYPSYQEGAYPSEHEWQYSPHQDGPYLPQPGLQYPIQPEVQYFPQQGGVVYPTQFKQRLPQQDAPQPPQQGYLPPQQEQQPPQQDGQQPPQQDGQQPPKQDGQQSPQQSGQQPSQQDGQLPPQGEGQYPPQPEVQYHAPYYQGYPYNYRPSEYAYIQPQVGPVQKSIGSFNTLKFPNNHGFSLMRQSYPFGLISPYYYLPRALNVPQVPVKGNI